MVLQIVLIPVLVSSNQLSSAVAITSAGFNLSRFLGPGIAGFVVTFYGLGFAYLVNAVTFIPVIISLGLIKVANDKKKSDLNEGYFQKLYEGFRYTLNHDLIRSVILIAGISSFFGRGLIELLPVFAAVVFRGGSDTLALLMAASGFGAVVASFIYMSGILDHKLSKAVFYGGFGLALSCLLFAVTESLFFGVIVVSFVGFFITFVAVGSQSEVQMRVADELRGRVSSLWTIVVLGGPALGSLFAGILVGELGVRLTAILFSLICLSLLFYIQFSRAKKKDT